MNVILGVIPHGLLYNLGVIPHDRCNSGVIPHGSLKFRSHSPILGHFSKLTELRSPGWGNPVRFFKLTMLTLFLRLKVIV